VCGTGTAPAPHTGAVALLPGTPEVHPTPDGWLAFTDADASDRVDLPSGTVTGLLTRSVRGRTADVEADALGTALDKGFDAAGEFLAGLLPPFAAVHRGPTGPVVLVGDWLGLRQLYWWQGDGVAAVSTSALALGRLAGAGLDTAALGVQSLVGWQLGEATVLRGVRKLAPGCAAVLRSGTVTVHRYVDADLTADTGPDVVDELATILRDIHAAYLADHPDTVLQLTGGQDSRILLCAVPPDARRGMRALTLDGGQGRDVPVARRLAALCGLDHRVHRMDELPPVPPKAAYQLAVDASLALDAMASPLALAPLLHVESTLEQGHRLSGAGGETARGFYYPGQPHGAVTEPRLVHRLADWRLFANEAVDTEALEPDFVAAARTAALDAAEEEFSGYSREWLRATDEFYLWQRTQRWAGAHGTVAAVQRHFVNPLLDRRVMQLALAPSPADKRDSRLTGRLITRLDARLAAVPLDSGLIPARLGAHGLATKVAVARVTAGKAAAKLRQRVAGARKAQLGAAELSGLVVAHWRAEPGVVAPLARTGLVRPQWMDELLAGRREAPPTTVAFLVNLLVAADATG